MKNERGLTLIEVLATITITSFILVVGFMIFSSANGLFNNTVQKSKDNVSLNTVVNTISRELANPVRFFLYSANELRFQTFDNRYMALKYDKVHKTLSLEQSNGVSSDITSGSFATQTPGKILATNLSADASNSGEAFSVRKKDNSTLLTTGSIIPDNDPADTLINIWLYFEVTTITVNGTKATNYTRVTVNAALTAN